MTTNTIDLVARIRENANRALSLADKQQWIANDGLRELATDALEAARRLENALETARGIAYDVRDLRIAATVGAVREAVGFES